MSAATVETVHAGILRAPPSSFACSWYSDGWEAGWVHATGELDLATVPQFRQTVEDAQRAMRLVVLDLRELSFMDCSGIRVILEADRAARWEGARLQVLRRPGQIDRLLTLTGVCEQALMLDDGPRVATLAGYGPAADAASRLAASWGTNPPGQPTAAA